MERGVVVVVGLVAVVECRVRLWNYHHVRVDLG